MLRLNLYAGWSEWVQPYISEKDIECYSNIENFTEKYSCAGEKSRYLDGKMQKSANCTDLRWKKICKYFLKMHGLYIFLKMYHFARFFFEKCMVCSYLFSEIVRFYF